MLNSGNLVNFSFQMKLHVYDKVLVYVIYEELLKIS